MHRHFEGNALSYVGIECLRILFFVLLTSGKQVFDARFQFGGIVCPVTVNFP